MSAVAGLEGYLLISAGNRLETLALATTTTTAPSGPAAGGGGGEAQQADQQLAYKFNRTGEAAGKWVPCLPAQQGMPGSGPSAIWPSPPSLPTFVPGSIAPWPAWRTV